MSKGILSPKTSDDFKEAMPNVFLIEKGDGIYYFKPFLEGDLLAYDFKNIYAIKKTVFDNDESDLLFTLPSMLVDEDAPEYFSMGMAQNGRQQPPVIHDSDDQGAKEFFQIPPLMEDEKFYQTDYGKMIRSWGLQILGGEPFLLKYERLNQDYEYLNYKYRPLEIKLENELLGPEEENE